MVDIRTDRRRRWGRLVAAPLGVVALVGLAACGTSTDTSAASSGAAVSASSGASSGASSAAEGASGGPSDAEMAAYTSCLAENGVTLPEPPAGRGGGARPEGGDPPEGETSPSGPGGTGGPGGPGGTPGEAPEGVDAATWAAAQEVCADLAPTPPNGADQPAATGT